MLNEPRGCPPAKLQSHLADVLPRGPSRLVILEHVEIRASVGLITVTWDTSRFGGQPIAARRPWRMIRRKSLTHFDVGDA